MKVFLYSVVFCFMFINCSNNDKNDLPDDNLPVNEDKVLISGESNTSVSYVGVDSGKMYSVKIYSYNLGVFDKQDDKFYNLYLDSQVSPSLFIVDAKQFRDKSNTKDVVEYSEIKISNIENLKLTKIFIDNLSNLYVVYSSLDNRDVFGIGKIDKQTGKFEKLYYGFDWDFSDFKMFYYNKETNNLYVFGKGIDFYLSSRINLYTGKQEKLYKDFGDGVDAYTNFSSVFQLNFDQNFYFLNTKKNYLFKYDCLTNNMIKYQELPLAATAFINSVYYVSSKDIVYYTMSSDYGYSIWSMNFTTGVVTAKMIGSSSNNSYKASGNEITFID